MYNRDALLQESKHKEPAGSSESETDFATEGLFFRFSLKHLFLVMTVLCLFFALLAAMSYHAKIYVLFAVFLLASHFIGAVIGTKLGQKADKQLAEKEKRKK